jgi:uncharacterized damage-inducible protein DinB
VNPYALFLGKRDPQQAIAETPVRLQEIFRSLGDEHARQSPGPGKWSAREILGHLADCEIVFAFRLRQALAEDHHTIQPFDQDRWAGTAAAYDVEGALAVFSAVREWNRIFIREIPPEALSKPVTHPERGVMTLQVLIETMAGHDLNHLRQLNSLVAAHGTD